MELPFFYINNNHPWSYYYKPLPRQRNRFPSLSRGDRIYEDDSSNSTSRTRLAQRTSTSNRRRASSTPLTSPARAQSRTMQASATIPPSRSSPHLWSTRGGNNNNNGGGGSNRPSVSFGRAARELLSTLDEALDYFRPLYNQFKEQTEDIRVYADEVIIDQVWVKKIVADVAETHGVGHLAQGAGEGGSEHETSTARDFCDHQAAVYNRCEDMLCAVPPSSLQRQQTRGRDCDRSSASTSTSSERGLEAAALVAKMARCRDDLFPALRRMGSRYVVVGTAIKEMQVLKSNLETYREVWDAEETG